MRDSLFRRVQRLIDGNALVLFYNHYQSHWDVRDHYCLIDINSRLTIVES